MPSHKKVTPLNRQQVAQHQTENDCWVIINGHVYDVTAFVKNHPGGRYILDAAGKDATAVFYSTHPDHAYRLLEKSAFKAKHFIATVPLDEMNHYHFLDPFYKEIRESVSSYLDKQHNKKTRNDTLIVWLLFFLAVNILAIRNFCSYGTFLSSVLLGLSIGLTEVNIGHSVNHGAIFPNSPLSFVLNHLIDLGGQNSFTWRMEHNYEHHARTGSKYDTEKQHHPFMRLHPSQVHTRISRKQHLHYPLLLSLHIPFTNLADFSHFTRECKRGNVKPADFAGYIIAKLIYIAFMLLMPIGLYGATQGALYSLVIHLVGGAYVTLALAANHTSEQCENYDIPNGRSWAKTQAACSANFHSGNRVVNFLTGGLSQQIEHHLFPALPPYLLSEIAPIVEQSCVKHNVPYNNFTSSFSLWKSFHQRIKSLSQDNQTPQLASM